MMRAAYITWLTTNRLLLNAIQPCLNNDEFREAKAIVERAFTSLVNAYGERWMVYDQQVFDKMSEEVNDNRKLHAISGAELSDMVRYAFENKVEIDDAVDLVAYFDDDCTFSIGEFAQKLPRATCERLLSCANVERTVLMLLRLKSIGFQGQQWAIPAKWFENIKRKHGLHLIGFASPVNVQIADVPFCSLDLEADAPFGSIGSFFEFDLVAFMQNVGKECGVVLNPPFIEDILIRAVQRVDEMFQLAETLDVQLTVFFNGPDWKDAKFYSALVGHKFLKRQQLLYKDCHAYDDCFTGEHIIARFRSKMFALCNSEHFNFQHMTDGLTIKKPNNRGTNRRSHKTTSSKKCKCMNCGKTFTPRQHWHKKCRDCFRK